MATISLFSSRVNQMPGLLNSAKNKVNEFQSDLKKLNQKILRIDSSACDVYTETGLIQASVSTQGDLSSSIEDLSAELDNFISEAVSSDADAAELIDKNKKDFYEKYSHLKPGCEKTLWEKAKDGLKRAGEWCKEHWKLVVTIVLVIAAIVVICVCPAAGVGLIALGAAKGLLAGALIGGLIGGISSAAGGGSFLDGFEDGAFSGALTGALFGGIGGAGELAGQVLGKSCGFIAKYGSAVKNITTAANVINFGLGGFDTISLVAGLFDPDCKLVQFNKMLHSSKLFNGFQMTVGAIGAFGGGMMKGIQYDLQNGIAKCFVAGTLVSTISGLTAIENIKAGDMVLSADPETGETGYRKVVETYIRETMKLVHLIINGEKIVTTEGHPFYVKDRGFVNAADLMEGDELTDSEGNVLLVESFDIEINNDPVKVYNFQVEEYHTYFVSDCVILVHNADNSYSYKTVEVSGKKENIPIVDKPGSPSWENAVKDLKSANGKGNNFIARNQAEAEMLINEAKPELNLSPMYDPNAPKANYQIHPIDNDYGMPHVKFQDWSNGKKNGCAGHIFW